MDLYKPNGHWGCREKKSPVSVLVQVWHQVGVKELLFLSHRLLKVRNPWGTFEWKGRWSDTSPEWAANPEVAKALNHKAADDGLFWMGWADFSQYFQSLDICARETGKTSIPSRSMCIEAVVEIFNKSIAV